jgi:hypothetical protein
MEEINITRENINQHLDHYATILTALMNLKERFEKEDEVNDISDAESLIDTDDIEALTDSDE